MKTTDKPSDLINQAITNSVDVNSTDKRVNDLSAKLREQLWESMKLASQIEILNSINNEKHIKETY